MPRFLMSAGCQSLRPDFFSCRSLNICQATVQSIALCDVWTTGWAALHAEHTRARRVRARDTSITWQEPTRRAWLWAPWRHHTQSESADKIMMRDNVTAARALHVEKAALKKWHSELKAAKIVFYFKWQEYLCRINQIYSVKLQNIPNF